MIAFPYNFSFTLFMVAKATQFIFITEDPSGDGAFLTSRVQATKGYWEKQQRVKDRVEKKVKQKAAIV